MVHRVEHGDGLTVHIEGVRNVHLLAERAADAFRDHRLPVAGRAIEKQRLAGVHRRSEALEHRVVDDQIAEPGSELLSIDVGPRRHARPNVGVVLPEGNGRGADIPGHLEELVGAIPAEIGQHVAIAGAAGAARSPHLDQLLDARVLHERLEQ